ncbi:MAG: hypothetical protein DMG72_19870 [Acidobacteria bacterium]|nr:MAG: hypothetical protein DMG72_19870 [Acidobacteriota bacterium]
MKRLLLYCVTVLVLIPASASQTSQRLDNKPRHSGTKSRENSLKVSGVPHASPNIAITKTNTQSSKLADPRQQLNSLERQTIRGQGAQPQRKLTAPIKAASVAEGKNPPLNFEFRPPKNGLQKGPPARGSKGSASGLNRRLNGTGR